MKNKLILPLFILLGLILGCSSIKDMVADRSEANTPSDVSNSATGPTRVSEDVPAAFAPTGDAKADIEKMADRFLSIQSFRAKMTSEGTMTMNADLDYIAPDRFRIKTELPNGQSSEMVLIGKQTYMKLGDRWQKMPIDIGTKVPNMRETFTREGMKWFKEIKYEGEESAEGEPAYLYSYDGEAPGGGMAYSSKIWVAKNDGRPVKIHATYKKGDMKSMKIVYDYETKVTIEPPVGN
jgi:Outer membrane lipoprotein-sorting protein